MTIAELKELRMNLSEELETLIANGEAEQRQLNDEENSRIAEIRTKMDEVDFDIRAIEEENERLAKQEINKENKTERKMENVKLTNLINGVVEGRQFSEAESAYMANARTINTRAAIVAGTATQGQEVVPEDKMGLDVAIRNASVLSKMGATFFSNAKGDISIPKYAGSTVAWKGEIVEAGDGAGEFSETILKPKRLTAYVDVSKQFLLQTDAENVLINDIANAVAEKLDATIFGSEAGTDDKPAGIFNGADEVSAMDYDEVLKLEEAVESKNGNSYIFLTNPKGKMQLKGAQVGHGLQPVFAGNEIDGVKAIVSNSIAGVAAIEPRDLAAAQWGGVEITVDTVSRAIYGEVRLVVNAYFDAKLRGDRVAVVTLAE